MFKYRAATVASLASETKTMTTTEEEQGGGGRQRGEEDQEEPILVWKEDVLLVLKTCIATCDSASIDDQLIESLFNLFESLCDDLAGTMRFESVVHSFVTTHRDRILPRKREVLRAIVSRFKTFMRKSIERMLE